MASVVTLLERREGQTFLRAAIGAAPVRADRAADRQNTGAAARPIGDLLMVRTCNKLRDPCKRRVISRFARPVTHHRCVAEVR